VSNKIVVIRAAILHYENINVVETDARTQLLPVLEDVEIQRNKAGGSDIDVLCEENQEDVKQLHRLEIEPMTGTFQANHNINCPNEDRVEFVGCPLNRRVLNAGVMIC
jgi:hypothetical protein